MEKDLDGFSQGDKFEDACKFAEEKRQELFGEFAGKS